MERDGGDIFLGIVSIITLVLGTCVFGWIGVKIIKTDAQVPWQYEYVLFKNDDKIDSGNFESYKYDIKSDTYPIYEEYSVDLIKLGQWKEL